MTLSPATCVPSSTGNRFVYGGGAPERLPQHHVTPPGHSGYSGQSAGSLAPRWHGSRPKGTGGVRASAGGGSLRVRRSPLAGREESRRGGNCGRRGAQYAQDILLQRCTCCHCRLQDRAHDVEREAAFQARSKQGARLDLLFQSELSLRMDMPRSGICRVRSRWRGRAAVGAVVRVADAA